MKKIFCLAILALSLVGCADENQAISACQTNGFDNCNVTDYSSAASWSGCGNDDQVAYDVTATNSRGNRVGIVVCCGWALKGCTIRTRN